MNIAIIGCGYVGLAVASLLKEKGHQITATTRSSQRLKELTKVAQKGVIYKGENTEDLLPLIVENDCIIITLAADHPDQYENTYLNTAQMLLQIALDHQLSRQLIYTSSTSVYGEYHGLWVDEKMPLLSKTETGKILIETETTYLALKKLGWKICTLRLAEIYGPGRELSRKFKELEQNLSLGSGDQYTNMVHREDVAHAIDYVIHHHLEGVFNLADDEHPTRKDLYLQLARQMNWKPLDWDGKETHSNRGNKRVSNHHIKSEGFSFLYPQRILN